MHKSNEDCFYFLTSSCAKGLTCAYRHSPLALTCHVICQSWTRGNCLDPACPYRHTAVQRPVISNGILCFYENTPMGCLKPDCTFIHSRPRMNARNTPTIRPLSTNLTKKDVVKPIATTSTPPTDPPQTTHVSGSTNNLSQTTTNGTPPVVANTTPQSASGVPASIVKPDTVARRIAVPSDIEQTKNFSDDSSTNLNSIKSTTRSVITDSPKGNQEETTATQSRLIVNRNVVLAESSSAPSRKIVQTITPPSSNRVVVSSATVHFSSKEKKNDRDCFEQENNTKKFKKDTQSIIDIPFLCSPPTIVNRVPFIPSKETMSTNDTKSIRLNRDRLSTAKTSTGNSPISVAKPSNEEKISAGTGLSQNDERRTMRIERFQKKPASPPRSIISSSSSSPVATSTNTTSGTSAARNVVTSSSNERKRTAPETTMKGAPPSKRVSISSAPVQSSPRQISSSPDVSIHSPPSSIRDKNWEKQTNEFIAKTARPKHSPSPSSPITTLQSSPVLSPVVQPRFTPQPVIPPPLQQISAPRTPRLRQPPSVVIKRALVPVTAPSQISTKPIEQISPNNSGNQASPLKPTLEQQTSNIVNEEDENQLLTLNESTDVVDTFALIDEALLEADHLLELM